MMQHPIPPHSSCSAMKRGLGAAPGARVRSAGRASPALYKAYARREPDMLPSARLLQAWTAVCSAPRWKSARAARFCKAAVVSAETPSS